MTTTTWTGGSRVLRLVVALALVLGVPAATVGATPAVAQAAGSVVDVHPRPADVVGLAGVGLDVRVATDASVEDVAVTVDGRPVTTTSRAVTGGVRVTGTLPELTPGVRTLQLVATTADGEVRRRWSVTATDTTRARLAGTDRHATAVTVSRAQFASDASADAVVLARSDDFADALAGGPLAAHLGAPLLLTATSSLPAVTRVEVDRVLAPGGTVHVLGGTAAVGAAVVRELRAEGHSVVRHSGPTRFDTAVAVADQLPPSRTAVVAAGHSFPDALAASAPAAREGWPILLTATDRLSAPTRDGLDGLDIESVVVVGGEAAITGRVVEQLAEHVSAHRRVWGSDRYATAAAIAETFFDDVDEVALASGTAFPDALGAAVRAARLGAPLLLTDPGLLPPATDRALRDSAPGALILHGGTAAIAPDVADAAWRAVLDGAGAPRIVGASPASGADSTTLAPIVLRASRALVATSLEASVTLGDVELPTTVRLDQDATRVVVDPLTPGDLPLDEPREVVVRLRGADADGRLVHHLHRFTLREDRGLFATVGGIELVEPSAAVEVVGYHQSNHEGAQQMAPAPDGPRWLTLGHRGRRTGSRTAADVVADEHVEVVAPVTGRVVRAGTYVLYCDHLDHYLAIEPDGHPGIEVKLLHFRGLRVGPGDRVEAGATVVGDGPRRLPFRSQVDEHSSTGYGPHVHVEVVDTSIPNVPNSGSGSDGC